MSASVLIMAGGTGGHIFPGLAVARALRERGARVSWLGAAGAMETRIVPEAGIELHTLSIGGLRGKSLRARLAGPWRVLRAIGAALRVLGRVRPDVVVGFGGFASGPGGIAAALRRIPLVIHEQNRIAGVTNRTLARFAPRVLTGFPDTLVRGQWTGNPVRPEIAALPAPSERFAARAGNARLLVLGGSLGAAALNETLPAAIALLPAEVRPQVRHQAGRNHDAATAQGYQDAGVDADVAPFIGDMAEAYGWADLVICRAGALTLAELAAAGVGALLVPYPHAVDDHQTHNAQFLVEAGAAELIPQSSLAAERLAKTLSALLPDRARLLAMAQSARSLARADAAERVADACLELVR